VDDFEAAWGALIARKRPIARGNFMFALMAMILLEFACRICAKDKSGKKLGDLTAELARIEPHYFTKLPGPCGSTGEFNLPGPHPESSLLGMMFDLIRNGKAHQYQSAVVTLSDGEVDLDLTGAVPGRELNKPGRRRPAKHMRYKKSASGLSLYIRTDQLFLDIKRAIVRSRIISPTDRVTDIARPRDRSVRPGSASIPFYSFTVSDLEYALKVGRHAQGKW
jgi:hypothetical protein